ncbi:MAG: hypothetical protein Q4E59_03440 [Bacteroidales bacterium]|nr:hypothetical protein [Bacteroidales bacterium]
MKRIMLWLDLIVCSLWVLAVLGTRLGLNPLGYFLVMMIIVLRLAYRFSMDRREKRSWLLVVGILGISFIILYGDSDIGRFTLARYVFYVLNLEYDYIAYMAVGLLFTAWIWLLPLVEYPILLFRKKLSRTDLKWKDLLGRILWHDRKAKTYSALMLVCLTTLYSGLTMDAKLCRTVCLVAPAFSYWLLCRYYGAKAEKVWVMVLGLVFFYYAQMFGGIVRIAMLAVSFVLATYTICRLYKATRDHLLLVMSILYLGILQPSMAIGHNQYTCLNYGRSGHYSHMVYNGVFYIEDQSGELLGLRDRYGLLIKPEYESINVHEGRRWYTEVELRRNGFYVIYDIMGNRIIKSNDIDEPLQKEVCDVLKNHFETFGSEYDDRCEAEITELSTGKVLADVKLGMYGLPHYAYRVEDALPADTAQLKSGETRSDSVQFQYSHKYTLSYVQNLPNDSAAVYRVRIRLATDSCPSKESLTDMVSQIANGEYMNGIK